MDLFPALDPIPLPAPVWLFKALHTLTLALHFISVHFLVGGLVLAIVWAFLGRARNDSTLLNASGLVVHRLPIVMTYVINLGVPPLLFTQVLYGRALYTSTVLIGVWWISVIALLIISYSFLYIMSVRADSSKATGWVGLIALAVVLKIGFIYTNNMTLMLRPEVWVSMYRENPYGLQLANGDPTIMPRWLFMMLGSIGVTGIALVFLSMKKDLDAPVTQFLRAWGGRVLAAFTAVQILLGAWVVQSQPDAVRAGLFSGAFYPSLLAVWVMTAVAVAGVGVLISTKGFTGWTVPSVVSAAGLANIASMVLVRDGIRDISLAAKGFDVWAQPVVTNWGIVIVFVLCLVLALGVMAWLVSVVARAKPISERYA
ncbi:MAG: hypothetical protein IT365_09915 [Candidatus Hydrogenedentes bacterium]|nr:hypothetical protein [Candidatus Hydrogenedentota bacterium]